MNLNYEEFKERIKDDIKDYMDEKYKDCEVVIRKVNKTNREVDGLNMLDIPGLKNATPTLYVNNLYEEYERTGNYEDVVRMAAETMENGIESFNKEIKADFLDTSRLKDNVFFTLINAEQNRELLKTVPHRKFEDLAIVYRWNLGNDSLGTYTNLVNNDLAAKEGLTENDLYNAANKNTKELFPVSIKNMNEVISEIIFGESELGEEMQEEFQFSAQFFETCENGSSDAKRYLMKESQDNVFHKRWKLYAPVSLKGLIDKGVDAYDAMG